MSIPVFQFISPYCNSGNHKLIFYIFNSISVLWESSLVAFFKTPCLSCVMWYLSLSDWLHSIWESLGTSMLLHMALLYSFLWLNNIILYVRMYHVFFILSSVEGSSLVAQMVKSLPEVWGTPVWSLDWEYPWRRKWQPTPGFLSGKSHGQRSLVGYTPWGRIQLDTTWQLTHRSQQNLAKHFSIRFDSWIFSTCAWGWKDTYIDQNNI